MIKINPFDEHATRDRIGRQIKDIVEQIMDPATHDDERYDLYSDYKKLDKSYKYLGGVYTEYLDVDGTWRKNDTHTDLNRTSVADGDREAP